MFKLIFIPFLIYLSCYVPAYAYIGPGISGGAIAATLGIIVAIFAALFGIIWFPIKRLFKKKKLKKSHQEKKVD